MGLSDLNFKDLSNGLPRFSDGRVDYSNAAVSPVISCAVYAGGKLLILRRSQQVSAYKGLWNGVSGFIDRLEPLEDLARRELAEECEVKPADIASINVFEPYQYTDDDINRTWLVFPVKVTLNSQKQVVLDREHVDYRWIDPKDLKKYEILQDFEKVVKRTMDS